MLTLQVSRKICVSDAYESAYLPQSSEYCDMYRGKCELQVKGCSYVLMIDEFSSLFFPPRNIMK